MRTTPHRHGSDGSCDSARLSTPPLAAAGAAYFVIVIGGLVRRPAELASVRTRTAAVAAARGRRPSGCVVSKTHGRSHRSWRSPVTGRIPGTLRVNVTLRTRERLAVGVVDVDGEADRLGQVAAG